MIEMMNTIPQNNPLEVKKDLGGDLRSSNKSKDDGFQKELSTSQNKDRRSAKLSPKQPNNINEDSVHRAQKERSAQHSSEKTVKSSVEPKDKISTASTKEEKVAIEPMTRTKAMSHFLANMQDQLGVEPFEIVEAYSKLSADQLTQSPEDTAKSVIAALELSPDQTQVAKGLYDNMLNQTAATNMAEYLQKTNNELSVEVLSDKEIRRREVDASITRMNEQFFMNGPKTKPIAANPQAAAGAYAAQAQNSSLYSQGQVGLESAPLDTNIGGTSETFNNISQNSTLKADAMGPQAQNVNATNQGSNAVLENIMKQMTPAEKQSVDMQQLEKMINQQSLAKAGEGVDVEEFNPLTQEMSQNGQKESILSAPNAKEGMSLSAKDLSAFQDNTGEGGENLEGEEFVNLKQSATSTNAAGKAEAFSLSATAKPSASDESANVREVINQAQYLAKKGGGEMKVKLNPEGLGEVNLKVNVNKGQVSVELITQNNDVKKLFEKGMGDLKATLMSHKINVDQIKVDVANNLQNSFEQQQQQAEQQFQHRFLEDFRRNNEQWRSGFFDTSGARSTKSQTDDEAMNDFRTNRARANGRLDLVA